MAKYKAANPQPIVSLEYHPYQLAFLDALVQYVCIPCGREFKATFGNDASRICPQCKKRGVHTFNRYVLIAGRRGGKTRIGTLACILELSFPNTYGWVCAPTFRDLTDFVEPMFFGQLPQDWVDRGDWSVSDRILTLPNGSVAAFRSLEDPEAVRGPGLDFLLMDETAKVSPKAWDVARPALADKQGIAIFPTTPKGDDWVRDRLWTAVEDRHAGWWGCRYTTLDNPHMQKSRDLIEEERKTMSAEMFRQEYEASFESFQGAIYGDLVEGCVLDDTVEAGYDELKRWIPEWPNINASRSAIVGLDPGSDHPFAGVFIVVTERGLLVYNEYEEREKPAATHAGNLRNLASGLAPRWGYDRSQPQMQIELAQHGIFAQPAENAVVAGIERVKSWMLTGRLKFVKSRTKKLVSALKSYRWAETEKKDGSTGIQQPYKRKDDLPDALRYGVMTWPQLPEPAADVSAVRDLSKLNPKDARDIQRMLKHERVEHEKVADGVGEFYTENDESDDYGHQVSESFYG